MLSLLATVCAGLFSGAAIYVNLVEHPARLSCGTELAVKEFGPSYRRGTVMQASLALVGCALGLAAWARGGDRAVLIAAVLLGPLFHSLSLSSYRRTSSFSIPAWTLGPRWRPNSCRGGAGCMGCGAY